MHIALVGLICFLAFLGKIFYLKYTGYDFANVTFPDERVYYIEAAKQIAEQGLSYFTTPRSLWNGPINPLWIYLWGVNIPVLKIVNLFLVTMAGVFVWNITKRIAGEWKAYFGLGLYLLYPPFLEFGPTLLTEPIFLSSLIFSLWLVVVALSYREEQRPKFSLCIMGAGGVIFGLATLIRPTIQLFPIFLGVVIVLAVLVYGFKTYIFLVQEYSAFLFGFLLIVAPLVVKNAYYFGEYRVANGFGAVLYLGNDYKKNGDEPVYSRMDFDTFELTKPYTHLDVEGDRILMQAALANIKNHPMLALEFTIKKIFKYLYGYPHAYFYPFTSLDDFARNSGIKSVVVRVWYILVIGFVATFGIWGLVSYGAVWGVGGFFLLLAIYLVGIHAVSFPIPRLALPLFLVLLPFAMVGVGKEAKGCGIKTFLAFMMCIISFIWVCFIGKFYGISVGDEYRGLFEVVHNLNLASPITSTDLTLVRPRLYSSTGEDPYIICPVSTFLAEKNMVVFVELDITPGLSNLPPKSSQKHLQLFWSETQDFSEAQSVTVPVYLDSYATSQGIYMFSPSLSPYWKGEIKYLRLDFIDHLPGTGYVLKELSIRK